LRGEFRRRRQVGIIGQIEFPFFARVRHPAEPADVPIADISSAFEPAWRPGADRPANPLTLLDWVGPTDGAASQSESFSRRPHKLGNPNYSAPIRSPDMAPVDTMSVSTPLAR
jgi:hypothetical protein